MLNKIYFLLKFILYKLFKNRYLIFILKIIFRFYWYYGIKKIKY